MQDSATRLMRGIFHCFRLLDRTGPVATTVCDLKGDLRVGIETRDVKYALYDLSQPAEPTVPLNAAISEERKAEEHRDIAMSLLGAGSVAYAPSWFQLIERITRAEIHEVLRNGDVWIMVHVAHKLVMYKWPDGAITVDVVSKLGVTARVRPKSDFPGDIVEAVAPAMGMTAAAYLDRVHIDGICVTNGVVTRVDERAAVAHVAHCTRGALAPRGMLSAKTGQLANRVLHTKAVGKCGRCAGALGLRPSQTQPGAAVKLSLCTRCARGAAIGIRLHNGMVYKPSQTKKAHLVRCVSTTAVAAVAAVGFVADGYTTQFERDVELARTLIMARDRSIKTGVQATSPLLQRITELSQFEQILAPRMVAAATAWARLLTRIRLVRLIATCRMQLRGEAQLTFEAACMNLPVPPESQAELFATLTGLLDHAAATAPAPPAAVIAP